MMKEEGWEETENISKISLHKQEDTAEEPQQESKNEDQEKKADTICVCICHPVAGCFLGEVVELSLK